MVWTRFSDILRSSREYQALVHGQAREVDRLPVPAASWVLALLSEDLERPCLVVVPRESTARAWVEASLLFRPDSSHAHDREAGRHADGGAVYFPAPALSPYQETEPSLLVRAQESVALARLLARERPTVVCTPWALFRLLPRRESFMNGVLDIRRGDEHPIGSLTTHLVEFGYHRSDLVGEVGEYAVRGGVFDLFSPGEPSPVRLDLFGDTVESIRRFDPITQRSDELVQHTRVLPLSLYRVSGESARALAHLLDDELDGERGMEVDHRLATLAEGGTFPGWESYLPLLDPTACFLPGLLPEPLVVAVDPSALEAEITHHLEVLHADFQARLDQHRLALPPERLLATEDVIRRLLDDAAIRLGGDGPLREVVDFGATRTDLFHNQLPRFPREVETARARGESLLIVGPEANHGRLRETLEDRGLELGPGGVELVAGDLERGFRLPPARIVVYGESQLFARRALERPRTGPRFGPFLSGLRDLKVGDFVVHSDHGVGQFVGMRTLDPGGDGTPLPPSLESMGPSAERTQTEVMEIVYASGKSLLLPLSRLDQVQKYSGIEGVAPRLDQLGGSSWNRTKRRVKKGLRDMAAELLKLYAERELAQAPAMGVDSDLQRQFEVAFEHEETKDQLEATAAIKADLESSRPMDRLLCGDVGFGKTEVAMRAAFKVVDNGYQVAVLAPTTILADQHLETFRRRLNGLPVTCDMISRFRSAAEVKEIRQRVEEGRVDILIGTHRLLSRDVKVPKLGLLIIDEEQRFGVAQKERLKQLRKDVHVLAMSATPVPRTLQLSLAGVRDLAVIESPPKDRMAVETGILPFTPELVREAIEFEIQRSGQVYYVYNRVETIERMVSYLREVVPDLRVTVGHGQLDERELARRMHAFTRGEYDVLVATTIIENGIDIPNVNTMIVHRADRFGLAQLYQLRGRVGRSDQLAYCYLLVPPDRILSEVARKRLSAIREFSDLGAGFRIAARDLEIRGAGNLLGAEQSGHIAEVGIETYLKMLEDTVRELKGEAPLEAPSATIDLPVAMSIPQDYIGDTNLRMEIYRRVASGDEDTETVLEELRDRFGPPPDPVRTLVQVAELKRLAEFLRVQSVASQRHKLIIRLRQDTCIDMEGLFRYVSHSPGANFSPAGVLTLEGVPGTDSLRVAQETLQALVPSEVAYSGP